MKKTHIVYISVVAVAVIVTAAFLFLNQNLRDKDDNIVVTINNTTEQSSEDVTEKATTKSKSKKSSSKSKTSSDNIDVSFPIELNSATAEELCCINGIGETLANKIIAYRDQMGGYTNRKQLLNVDGIGEAKLFAIWDYIYIENEQEYSEDENADASDIQENNIEDESIAATDEIYIDLNEADFDELMLVPGFDEEICESILELRDKIGYFSNVYELLYADHVTKDILSEAEEYIYVEDCSDVDNE